jgi:BASS family bile acid:Na+ symporter
MMLLGLALGMLLGGFPSHTKEISMISLALLMTLSLSNVRLGETRGRDHVEHSARALLINYGLLTGVILAIGLFFSRDYWWGWVLMAAAPSAISIVPFTAVIGGQTTKALFSTAVNYLAALLLMPIITLILIGSSVSSESLVTSLLLLILLPMAASRMVMRLDVSKSANTMMINISFAVLIFAVTGANRDAFLGDAFIVIAIAAGCILRTFGTGMGTEVVLKRLGVPKASRVPYVLFASYKNLGLTATLAIALFQPIVAVPATIGIVVEVVWVIFLVRYYRRTA